MEKEGDDQNPETRAGTAVSSLMQVQKEKSPKTVPTRPAGLRRGAEEKRRRGKREEDYTKESEHGKERRRPKPGNAAGNAGVKLMQVQKEKSPKTVPTRPARSPKRS